MRQGGDTKKLLGDSLNSSFQGFLSQQQLHNNQHLHGLAIVLDDEFNFMLSHWQKNMLNSHTIIRTTNNQFVIGSFGNNLPIGSVGIHQDGFKIFLCRTNIKSKEVEWSRQVGVIDTSNNVFYLIELSKKDDLETTLEVKGVSQTSRYDKVKLQWKIKIVDRFPLKNDGLPLGNSKYSKKYDKKIDFNKGEFTVREQNQINLLSSSLGNSFNRASLVSIPAYIRQISKQNQRINVQSFLQQNDEVLLLTLASNKIQKRHNEKLIGLTLNISYNFVRSLGFYNQSGCLHGLGVQYRRNKQSFIGLFKDNLLAKQYKSNTTNSKSISNFQIRQLLMQQHLKSLNFINQCLYIPQLTQITGISNKIIKYIEVFQRQYQKRNSTFNDTPSEQSMASDGMNIFKYVDYKRQEISQSSRKQILGQSFQRDYKKPGFIFNKSNNKSVDKSPKPLQKSNQKRQKSPLRHVRIKGKIYNYSNNTDKSYSPQKTFNKLNLNNSYFKKTDIY